MVEVKHPDLVFYSFMSEGESESQRQFFRPHYVLTFLIESSQTLWGEGRRQTNVSDHINALWLMPDMFWHTLFVFLGRSSADVEQPSGAKLVKHWWENRSSLKTQTLSLCSCLSVRVLLTKLIWTTSQFESYFSYSDISVDPPGSCTCKQTSQQWAEDSFNHP